MPELTTAERLLYSTVKIIAYRNGNPVSSGTGFFYLFQQTERSSVPCIVTNKHVVQNAEMLRIRCHFAENEKPSGQFVNCDISLAGGVPFWHPNPDIDLCAIPFNGIIEQANSQSKSLFYCFLDKSILPKDDDWQYFDSLEDVLMIGCPNGISDEVNNLPIARRGVSATSLSKDYNGKPEFMVDMACFPGSSGSPIFVYDRNGYLDRRSNTYNLGATRLQLVGILYSGPLISNSGKIILSHLPRVETASMMHLGNAIKSSQLNVLDDFIGGIVSFQPPLSEVGPVVDDQKT